jgi:endoglucanase
MLYQCFKKGINLGGYLSQYEIIVDVSSPDAVKEHFDRFIRQEDLDRIASWGFDHVRIPLDGYLFYDRENHRLIPEPMAVLERCLDGCEKAHLNAILDLHNFWGHQYGSMDKPTPLMLDREIRADFCRFWQLMAAHFKGREQIKLLFELLNEVNDATGYCWNQLCKDALSSIRSVDANRWILVGSNNVNSVGYLDRLVMLDDPLVFYNFHFYEPTVFTHQLADFAEEFRLFRQRMDYPGDMSDYLVFLSQHPSYQIEHFLITDQAKRNDRDLMVRLMEHAERFMRYSGRELYCGEFGVIDTVSEDEAVKWLRDYIEICDSLRIGHAMWNYKCLDFEILNEHGDVVRPKILSLLRECNAQ